MCESCPDYERAERGCSRYRKPRPSVAALTLPDPRGPEHPDIPLWDCPVNLVGAQTWAWVQQYRHLRAGRQWHPGAVSQWPARDDRAVGILSSEIARLEAEMKRRGGDHGGA